MNLSDLLPLVRRGDLNRLLQLEQQGETEGFTGEEKRLLVAEAARAGQAETLRFLFEHHLYSADPDGEGNTVLHDAGVSGDEETLRFALDVLAFDPLEGNRRGVTPLDLASRASDPSGLALLKSRLGFGPEETYRNPVLRGCHPDPSIICVGEDFYLVNSSFVFFPGLPVFHSRDLVRWQEIGHAVDCLETSGLQDLPGGFGYWAPDISFDGERFWVIATLRRNTKPYRLQMLTSAPDPRGPWSPPVFLPLDGIDPSLFRDEDGRRYVLLNPGAMIAEIDEAGNLLSPARMISFGAARIKPEGPHLLRKDGWYYLFLAEGGTGEGHMETVHRSRSLMGPYESCPFNPVLGRRSEHAHIQRSGHGQPVRLPDGRWYMAYLCGRFVEGMTLMGRETALDPMTWTAEGWPMVNGLRGPSCQQRLPFPAAGSAPEEGEAWISPRGNPGAFARAEDGALILRAGADPAGLAPCSVLLRRQREAFFTQEVLLDLSGAEPGCEAGLIGYYAENSFCFFGLRKEADGCALILTEQAGAERSTRHLASCPGVRFRLRASGRGLTRAFSLLPGDQEACAVTLRTPYLCDEGIAEGKRFTGAMLGFAAVGAGEARFEDHHLVFSEEEA